MRYVAIAPRDRSSVGQIPLTKHGGFIGGWCATCGPVDDPTSFTPARCANCHVARRRAPRQAVPHGGRLALCSGGREDTTGRKVCKRKQCEDCHVKQAYWGMADRRMRWCSKCAKASPGHPGSIDLINKKCEDCKTKSQVWGLLSEGRKRWCASCGKTHKGAGAVSQTKCRGCQGPRPTYAMAIGQRAIWCARCGKANNGVACPRVKRDRQLPPVPAPPSPGATVGMASLSAVASAAVARTVATAVVVLQPEAARASTAAERARCIACAHGGCSVHLAPEEAALSEA